MKRARKGEGKERGGRKGKTGEMDPNSYITSSFLPRCFVGGRGNRGDGKAGGGKKKKKGRNCVYSIGK